METMQETGQEVPVVPVEAGAYLLDALFDVGPALAGGMGEVPLTYTEVRAYWPDAEDWEARTLVEMSRAYLSGKGMTGVFAKSPLDKAGEDLE